jgi:hypothetical protein
MPGLVQAARAWQFVLDISRQPLWPACADPMPPACNAV